VSAGKSVEETAGVVEDANRRALVGETKGGLLAWQMLPDEMPEPAAPFVAQGAA
jgi:hypothetical protein